MATPAFFSEGFRPFFFSAAAFAAVAMPVWMAAFAGGAGLVPNALAWHAHEMLYGYLGAVLAGFLMTAVPNWTGRLPIAGMPLAALLALWLAGRVAMAWGIEGEWLVAAIDAAFPLVLTAFIWREVLSGKNWRNLPVCALVALFAIGNILWHLEGLVGLPAGAGLRAGVSVAVLLMSLIGGRIIPSFTTNWLKKRGARQLPAPFGLYDKVCVAATVPALLAWCVAPEAVVTGAALIVLAALHLVRLVRWRGMATLAEPLVAVLHLAYGWLPLGFALVGLSILRPETMSGTAALHALTAGAIGQLTMAVMTRASLGHGGRALTAGVGTTSIYALIGAGAALRVAAPWLGFETVALIWAAGTLWSAGFLLFAVLYSPLFFAARRHG